MIEIIYAYFVAGGRTLDAIVAWDAKFKAAQDAYSAFFDKTGISHAYGKRNGHSFIFEGDSQPKVPGFRLEKRSARYWSFDKKTAEGKALAQEWAGMSFPRFNGEIVGVRHVYCNMRLYRVIPEKIGDTWVLSCPYIEKLPEPFDSRHIKTSEYWAMKESAQATA